MKDLYELLNDVDIDEKEFEEMEVNDIEKKKLKNSLKNKIKNKNKFKKRGLKVASILLISAASFGIAFPSYAKNLPIVKNIFKAIDTGVPGIYDNFKENANEINVAKSFNGTQVTLNEAVFNGRTLTLTYTVKTDKDLGKSLSLLGEVSLKNNNGQQIGSTSRFNKIDTNTYIGIQSVTFSDFIKNPKDNISFNLNINEIYYYKEKSEDSKSEVVKGNWNFKVDNLKAIKGKTKVINKSVEKDGITATIKEISLDPMSTFVSYSQRVSKEADKKWSHIYTFLEAKDDLGNIYLSQDNGGNGTSPNNIDLSTTFGKIKKGAKKLIITPKVDLSKEKFTVSKENNSRISLDEIVIDLNK